MTGATTGHPIAVTRTDAAHMERGAGADLTWANLTGVVFDASTIWPAELDAADDPWAAEGGQS